MKDNFGFFVGAIIAILLLGFICILNHPKRVMVGEIKYVGYYSYTHDGTMTFYVSDDDLNRALSDIEFDVRFTRDKKKKEDYTNLVKTVATELQTKLGDRYQVDTVYSDMKITSIEVKDLKKYNRAMEKRRKALEELNKKTNNALQSLQDIEIK